jgi:carboxymethylenebutenolidase
MPLQTFSLRAIPLFLRFIFQRWAVSTAGLNRVKSPAWCTVAFFWEKSYVDNHYIHELGFATENGFGQEGSMTGTELHNERVALNSATGKVNGYLVLPSGAGTFPAVVVIHEAYGLNDNMRDIAQRFAREGYAALAVDLFAGRNQVVCMFRYFAGSVLNSLNHSGISGLKDSLSWLEKHPQVDGARVGAIGFCLGGGFAIAWASADPRLKVIAPFYGMNPRPLDAVARSCPVVGSYPENDFTKGAGQKLEAKLSEHHIEHDIKTYPEAKHSFFNDRGPNFNATAAEDSWTRTLAFFKQHLQV